MFMKKFEKRVKASVREHQSHQEEQTVKRQSKEYIEPKNLASIDWLNAGGSVGEYLENIGKNTEEKMLEEELEDMSEALSGDENLLLDEKAKNMKKIGKDYRSVVLEMKWLDKIEQDLLENGWSIQRKGYASREIGEALQKLNERRERAMEKLESNMQSNPEAWYVHHLLTLRGYKRLLLDGKLVRTPYVKERFDKVRENIRTAQPVFISGHLGSGKSQLAFQVAEETYQEINPESKEEHPFYRISGDENVTRSDFFGRYVLKGSKKDETLVEEIREKAEKQFDEWAEKQDEKTLQRKGTQQWDLILAEVHNNLDTGNTTEFEYGPVYKAMEEGKVLVIDEANAIPHETLICLNDILASVRMTSGKNTVVLQHNGGKKVVAKPGFNIILTGNLNTQTNSSYVGRQPLDPAFLSRFTRMEYDYVPQSTEGGLDEASMEDELFHILLAKVMDRRGNIYLSKGSMEKIWELAKTVRILQESFSGKRKLEYDGIEKNLEKNVPSIRSLVKVFEAWGRDEYRHTLDYHLKESFVDEIDDETTDRDFIEQYLKNFGGFFEEGYDKLIDRDDFEFIYKEQVAEYAFGEAPEHTYTDTEVPEHAVEEKEVMRIQETISSIAIELQEIGCTV